MRANLFLGLLLGVSACGNSAEERVKLAEQQKAAEQTIAKAEQQARDGVAQAQKEVDRLKTELEEAKKKLEEAAKSQAAGAVDQKQLEAAIGKARKAYKALASDQYAELEKEIKDIKAKAATAPAATRKALTKVMEQLAERQKAALASLKEFDAATLDNLDAIKAKVDKELGALRASVRAARAKLPKK